jgi:predicted MFS family arabinose efflux permease
MPTLARRLSALPYNERVLYTEVAFQAIVDAGAMSFLSVFLVRLGAANWQVGLLDSLPALVMTVASLPMVALIERKRSLVAIANWGRFLFRAVIGSFALLPFLPQAAATYLMILARGLVSIPAAASNVAFVTLLGRVASAERRPRMLSIRMAINGLAASVAGYLAGEWLGFARYPLNYSTLFLSAFVAGLASIYILSRLRLAEPGSVGKAAKEPRKLGNVFSLIRSTPILRRYCLATTVFHLGLSMPSALYAIYRVRTMGASDAWIGILFTVERVLSVLTYLTLSRLLSRPKWRRWLWVTCVGVALYPLTMSLARTPAMLLLPSISGGIIGSAMNIFIANTLFQITTEENRLTLVAADATLANVAAFVAPMLGTALADATNINLALLIIAGVRVVSGLSYWALGVARERGA